MHTKKRIHKAPTLYLYETKKLCLFLPVGGFENGMGCFVLSMTGLLLSTHWSECFVGWSFEKSNMKVRKFKNILNFRLHLFFIIFSCTRN